MTADEKLKTLGFELVAQYDTVGTLIYENKEDDQRVELNYDGDDWLIHSYTISEYTDWYGNLFNRPIGMKYEECKAFLDKIDEMKDIWK